MKEDRQELLNRITPREEHERKIAYRHDYKVALVGAIAGGLLGLIGGCFSSEFMVFIKSILP